MSGAISDLRSASVPKNWPPEETTGSVLGPLGVLVAMYRVEKPVGSVGREILPGEGGAGRQGQTIS